MVRPIVIGVEVDWLGRKGGCNGGCSGNAGCGAGQKKTAGIMKQDSRGTGDQLAVLNVRRPGCIPIFCLQAEEGKEKLWGCFNHRWQQGPKEEEYSVDRRQTRRGQKKRREA